MGCYVLFVVNVAILLNCAIKHEEYNTLIILLDELAGHYYEGGDSRAGVLLIKYLRSLPTPVLLKYKEEGIFGKYVKV